MIPVDSEGGSLEPDVSCSTHKLLELWDGIAQLIKKKELEFLEERSGDPRKKRLQVSAGTLECKPAEVRKRDSRLD
jgi:hypothetical protein